MPTWHPQTTNLIGNGLRALLREPPEAEIAVRALLERFPSPTLENDAPRYRPNPVLRGLKSPQFGI